MVTSGLMEQFKGKLTDEPQTLRSLARKLDRDVTNARVVLKAMAKLGICEQVDLPLAKGPRQAKKGWRLRG
ncbi:MAG: hypothetical protein ACYDHX_07815 [Methanothrix sp.]